MEKLIEKLCGGHTPFCLIQKQDSEDILVLTGEAGRCRKVSDIPRKRGGTGGRWTCDTISVVPFCQIRERGFRVNDGGEHILTIRVTSQQEVEAARLIPLLPSEEITLSRAIAYDADEAAYRKIIEDIIVNEIGNGEGANFVIPRNAGGRIEAFDVARALTIFKSLVQNDYGTYWKFVFYDTERFFIGSTPERHLYVGGGRVRMNPISGTLRKKYGPLPRKRFKEELLHFLSDQKEINELFMVVDEELKMMAKMCGQGGEIIGPVLKEMSRLIHTEYLLLGRSDKDIFDLFVDSMFAATVVGSPVESACRVLEKYGRSSRRYYGSAMMLVGRDEQGRDFLDSPITIRTVEIERDGTLNLGVGATLVRDSVPAEEVLETEAKGAAVLASVERRGQGECGEPMLPGLANDDEVIEALVSRNRDLSSFWFSRQEQGASCFAERRSPTITIIHNEDDFVYMLAHMLNRMGALTTIVRYDAYDIRTDQGEITLLGPGPGNPNDLRSEKIRINHRIAEQLLEQEKSALCICLGHQVLCSVLGYEVKRKVSPLQGVQLMVDLFGRQELVGFYNTFAPVAAQEVVGVETAVLPTFDEVVAVRGASFVGYQFHPESVLTQNGYGILEDTLVCLGAGLGAAARSFTGVGHSLERCCL